MGYGLILVIGAIALSIRYAFMTEAPLWSRALVVGILLISLAHHSLLTLLLQAGLSVFILLYLRCLKES